MTEARDPGARPRVAAGPSDDAESGFRADDVYALDNIRLDLPYAGAGARVMAGVIDYAIFYALALALALAAFSVLMVVGLGGLEALGGWIVAIGFLVFFLFESFWFAGQEILLGGQTLGKRALHLRVLAREGHEASTVAILLRNLVRSVDILLGAWFLVFDPRSRRLGDRLGGTVVVHESDAVGGGAIRRVPRGWNAEKIRIAEELLDRLFVLDDERARELSRVVLRRIERDDPDFLADIPDTLAPTTRLAAAFGAERPLGAP